MSVNQLVDAGTAILDEDAGTHFRRLGALETRGRFDQEPMSDADALTAWDDADAITDALDAASTRTQRITARFDTRVAARSRG